MRPEIVFKAMADRTRQRALAVLADHELTVSELVEVLGQPQSTISRHLKVLRDAGLIRDRRNRATVLYTVRHEADAGNGSKLGDRIMDWVALQPMPPALARRLQTVMHRRMQMSDAFFHEVGRHWDSVREESFGATFHLEALLALLPSAWTVADIGTGTGYLLPVLGRHFECVIGVDPVETMLEAARCRVADAGVKNVDLRTGDLSELPITEATVDLAVAFLVLHHVPSPQGATAELARIVRPGGHVLVVEQATHDDDSFRERMQDRWSGFEPAQCAAWLEEVGFEHVQSRHLATVEQAVDAPQLFVVTGLKKMG